MMVCVIAWPRSGRHTQRSRYCTIQILTADVILRRLCYPAGWSDLEVLFGKHGSQLSEIFWEGLELFLETRERMDTSNVQFLSLLRSRAENYAEVIAEKSEVLVNGVGFIDAIVIGIARPREDDMQREVYNGQKRKNALKYQAVTTPSGFIANFSGPIV